MSDEELRHLLNEMRQENAAAHVETRNELRREFRSDLRETEQGLSDKLLHTSQGLSELRETVGELRIESHETAQGLNELRETVGELRETAGELRSELRETEHRLTRKIEISDEATEHRFQRVADIVGLVKERLDFTAAALDAKIERTTAETQALIRSSYGSLDRRVQQLEAAQRSAE